MVCRGLRFEHREMKSKLELPQHAIVNLFSLIFFYSHNGLRRKGQTAQSIHKVVFLCPLFPGRMGIWNVSFSGGRKTFGARIVASNNLNPHVTPGPGMEPGPQQWEATPLTNKTSLLPFFTVILRKITCCTCDLPLSMLSNDNFLYIPISIGTLAS